MAKKQTVRQFASLDDAYITFIVDREARQFTPKTLTYYRERLTSFLHYCAETRAAATINQVSTATVRAYLLSRQQRGLSPHTVHGDARALRAFLRFCAADGLIDVAPVFQMPQLPKKILPAFEPAQVERLLDACLTKRDRLIVLTLLDTGLRAQELLALDGGDVDDRNGAVLVRLGKGQKQRTVYLGGRTRRELVRYWRDEGRPAPKMPIWTSQNEEGERLTTSGLRQLLARLGERAGVPHCHPHTFRRTFALWSLRGGMDVHTLAALMGHSDIQVLKQYLALTGRDLQRAHQAAGPVDHMLRR